MAIRLSTGAMPVFPALGRRVFSCRHLVVVAGLLAACSGEVLPASREGASYLSEDAGRPVELSPTPRRILSLLPSATELPLELGESSRLVARTVIVVPSGEDHSLQPEWLSGSARWRSVRAVREGRLVVADSNLSDRPRPRVVDAARALAQASEAGGRP
jgi:ABC-type Fe3+-hydroxamate transport system substrate-binding protein